MKFHERLRTRREELGLSRQALAQKLGVTLSAVSNYETAVSFPKSEVLMKLFDALEIEPNALFHDCYKNQSGAAELRERRLLENYRRLSPSGRNAVDTVVGALCAFREECLDADGLLSQQSGRRIRLYKSFAAIGYAEPVPGQDYDDIPIKGGIPPAAEFAVRVQGDTMAPYLEDGAVAYVNRDGVKDGDAGIFCVNGDIFCKQYYKDPSGMVYLFSLNRDCADTDMIFPAASSRGMVCLGRIIMRTPPLPGRIRRKNDLSPHDP